MTTVTVSISKFYKRKQELGDYKQCTQDLRTGTQAPEDLRTQNPKTQSLVLHCSSYNECISLLAVPMLQAQTHSYVLYIVATVFARSAAAASIYFTTQLLVACVMQQRSLFSDFTEWRKDQRSLKYVAKSGLGNTIVCIAMWNVLLYNGTPVG